MFLKILKIFCLWSLTFIPKINSQNLPFSVGENLKYEVKFGFINAGNAELSIPNYFFIDGNETFQVTFTVRSNSAFDLFYKVRDSYQSFIDSKGIFSRKFDQNISEGKFKRSYSADLYPEEGYARSINGNFQIEKNTQDILSAFYFIRSVNFENLKPGNKIKLKNFYKDKMHNLEVIYVGNEQIQVDAGTFNCLKLEPVIMAGGLFRAEGKVILYLTNDERRLPIRVETKIIIGSIVADLVSFKGLNGELKAKK
ncbi:MAG: DUF3108 domain-containing protein [Bacteroidetes bacterium]|nr:DUF3108 domain-containing protein [Bacteroidota bacterium]